MYWCIGIRIQDVIFLVLAYFSFATTLTYSIIYRQILKTKYYSLKNR